MRAINHKVYAVALPCLLDHSISTEADTWDELKQAIRDATRCHFDEADRPDLIRMHQVREEVLAA
jgi:hypothetical protein